MKGKAKEIIDKIILSEGGNDDFQRLMAKSKLVMKGILVDKYTSESDDSQEDITRLTEIAKEFNVKL